VTVVAAYYFPGWHADPRCDAWHGRGWSEWRLLAAARPRFDGHRQPIEPAWGAFDESDPAMAARQIDLAADHGVDAFLFDWYWYDGADFLHRALDHGHLRAPNRERVRFALMWANHDWHDVHPAPLRGAGPRLLRGAVSPEEFEQLTEVWLDRYLLEPDYLWVDGAPYLSIYELGTLVSGLGGVQATAEALAAFQERARERGLPGVHLNAVAWGVALLPSEHGVADVAEVIRRCGFASVTSYAWVHHIDHRGASFPTVPHADVFAANRAAWAEHRESMPVPYHPNVTVGWDSSPRTLQTDEFEHRDYPWLPVIDGATPAAFEDAMRAALEFAADLPERQRMVTVNAWNEWTEGSYLLADTRNGAAHLEALARAANGSNGR
jgi:Glycosyltransferase WbsX